MAERGRAQQQSTLADLAAARQELLDALEGLSEEDLQSPLASGEWRIRDMLAHISHWNRWGLNRLRQMVKYGPETISSPSFDAEEINRHVAEAWGLHPVKDVLMEFENCYEDVVSYVHALPAEWTEGEWQLRGKAMTLKKWFAFATSHERGHAEDLRRWRARR
ncbi:MAG: DinB family protein [Anaerolineae bacterium]|nr:DinB family protein [Anaerolineae bacterium]